MKKYLMMVIVMFIFALSSFKIEATKVEFHGLAWIVNWYVNNGDFNDAIDDHDNAMYGRITLASDIDFGNDIFAHIAILQEAFWSGGIGPPQRIWSTYPAFNRAYIKIANLLIPGLSLSLGRLPFHYAQGLVLDDFVNMGYDGVKLTYKRRESTTDIFAAKVLDQGREEFNIFGVYSINDLMNKKLNVHVYSLHTHNSYNKYTNAIDKDSRYYIGSRAIINIIKGLTYTGEFAYLFGKDKERDVNRRAWALTNKLAFRWGKLRIGGAYFIGTGDDPDTKENELYSNPFGTPYFPEHTGQWPGFGQGPYFGLGYYGDFVYEISDDRIMDLFVQFFINEDWDIRLDYLQYKKYVVAPDEDENFGSEVQVVSNLMIRDRISSTFVFGYFMPGKRLATDPRDPCIVLRTVFGLPF
ncbi:MAG: hypothetical protein ACTSV7_11615 [Candidatus Baldrarchaeia archaeon]